MRLLYFASVRERIGLAEEQLDLPAGVATAADLLAFLAGRGESYACAFEVPATVRVAADHRHVEPGTDISAAREIALFPPMTGG